MHAEGFDKGRFANAGHAGNADANRFPRLRQKPFEHGICLRTMVAAPGFDEGDGPGEGSPVTFQHALGQAVDI